MPHTTYTALFSWSRRASPSYATAILGSGYDEVDGAYEINEGRWSARSSGARVAWIESYQIPPFCREFKGAPFEVALRGQVRPDGTILAIWASSRGIGGTVELLPPVGWDEQ